MGKLLRLTALTLVLSLAPITPASAEAFAMSSAGGWIDTATGGKGTFGFFVGLTEDLTFRGELVYVDQDSDFRLKSTEITSFTPGCLSTFQGEADTNLGPVQYVVTVIDGGEPGTTDTFSILVVSPDAVPIYLAAGTLRGGDIQAHGLACPPPP